MAQMTRGERADMAQLVRKREKVMRASARERSLALLAEFEAQMATIHSFDDDDVWAEAMKECGAAVEAARKKVAKRCKKLGIPDEMAPIIQFGWYGRGHTMLQERQAELRRVAKAKVASMEAEAFTRIERASLDAQEKILALGLESAAARSLLESLPKITDLMPPIEVGEIQLLLETKKKQQKARLGYSAYDPEDGALN